MTTTPYETLRFKTDDEWRLARTTGIGGSDVAAALGLSSYKSPFMLWQEKTGRTETPDISDKPSVEWGVRLEAVVADKFAENHPTWKIRRKNATLASRTRPWARANVDRIIIDENGHKGILEIKTAGAWRAEDWAQGVPDYYLPQPTHYLSVTGFDFMCVAVLIGGQDYREYHFARDDGTIAAQDAKVDAFWHDYVEADVEPPLTGIDAEMDLFKTKTLPKTDVIDLPPLPDVEELTRVKDEISDLTKRRKQIEATLLHMMGDHQQATCGEWNLTARQTDRTSVDYARYAKDHPGCFDDCTSTKHVFGGLFVSKPKQKGDSNDY